MDFGQDTGVMAGTETRDPFDGEPQVEPVVDVPSLLKDLIAVQAFLEESAPFKPRAYLL